MTLDEYKKTRLGYESNICDLEYALSIIKRVHDNNSTLSNTTIKSLENVLVNLYTSLSDLYKQRTEGVNNE